MVMHYQQHVTLCSTAALSIALCIKAAGGVEARRAENGGHRLILWQRASRQSPLFKIMCQHIHMNQRCADPKILSLRKCADFDHEDPHPSASATEDKYHLGSAVSARTH